MLTDDTVLGDQVTVVIVPASAETLDEANIYYINQDAFGNKEAILLNMGIKGTELAKGDYLVKLGGSNGVIKTAKFTVGDKITWQYGDVNGDKLTDTDDALEVIYYDLGLDSVFDDNAEWRLLAGDVNTDDLVDTDDALEIIYYDLGLDSVLDSLLN